MSLAYLRARYPAAFAALEHSEAIFAPPPNLNNANNMNAAEAITALHNIAIKPQPPYTMTYQSLTEALARLADDPRIHPNTKIELEVEHEIAITYNDECATEIEHSTTAEPLISISIHPGTVRLSSARSEPAAAR